MDERRDELREEPLVERERTTIIKTGGDRGGGGGGALLAIVLLLALAVLAFVIFGDGLLNGGGTDVKIDVKAPDVDLPKVDPPSAPGK